MNKQSHNSNGLFLMQNAQSEITICISEDILASYITVEI